MANNSSKYSFLLTNDNDNFVINDGGVTEIKLSNDYKVKVKDYNFDYLFTTYSEAGTREVSKPTSPLNIPANRVNSSTIQSTTSGQPTTQPGQPATQPGQPATQPGQPDISPQASGISLPNINNENL